MPSPNTIPSDRYGAYTLARKLGEGGMAEVFLGSVIDESGNLLPVAIKIAKPLDGLGLDVEDLFTTEADLMRLLAHPGVVKLYEVGQVQERIFLSMEFLSGGDLAAVLAALRRKGRHFPAPLAVQLGLQVLRTLAFVHTAKSASGMALQIVHGDVNPGNIFLDGTSGIVKLGDFGMAHSQTIGVGLPDGIAGGKLNYLSPEQAAGLPVTPATDLFAMATVLYELLFGVRPFEDSSSEEILERIAQCRYSEDVPMTLWQEEFFSRAFARSAKHRFKTAGAMAGELYRVLFDELGEAFDGELGRFLEEAIQE
ncbi:MAG: serine/threonine protein kinase [Myxococcales bacterium]|jgi:serine/threonine-protein kinase|nr:serine/threonine protein kinase [Myxococcales bacterium]